MNFKWFGTKARAPRPRVIASVTPGTQAGDEAVVLGHRLRPTFENLCAAEGELGPLFALVERAAAGGVTLAETTALLWWCVDAGPGGGRPERAAFGEALVRGGLAGATGPLRAVLRQVLAGVC